MPPPVNRDQISSKPLCLVQNSFGAIDLLDHNRIRVRPSSCQRASRRAAASSHLRSSGARRMERLYGGRFCVAITGRTCGSAAIARREPPEEPRAPARIRPTPRCESRRSGWSLSAVLSNKRPSAFDATTMRMIAVLAMARECSTAFDVRNAPAHPDDCDRPECASAIAASTRASKGRVPRG
jgi:hypothetical protein